jgi:hypothetical protein
MRKLQAPRQNRDRVVLALAVTALLAAGCGSTKTSVKPPAPSSTSSTTTLTTSTTAPATAAGRALAAKAAAAVLKPADFPYGWTPQPPDPTGGLQIERLWQNLAHCLNVDNTTPPPVLATSPTFKRGLATNAVSTVEYTTPPSAAAIAAALGAPTMQGCITGAYNANAQLSHPEGAVPGPAKVSPLTLPPAGDKEFSYRVNVTMDLSGLKINLFHDFRVVFKGDSVIRMWFLNPGSPFPPDLENTLVANVVGRA